jgi:hypothetical protein
VGKPAATAISVRKTSFAAILNRRTAPAEPLGAKIWIGTVVADSFSARVRPSSDKSVVDVNTIGEPVEWASWIREICGEDRLIGSHPAKRCDPGASEQAFSRLLRS